MKNRKPSAAIAAATVAASLALAFGASAPASASNVKTYYQLARSITIYCPTTMVARVSFKSTSSGKAEWGYHGNMGTTWWSTTTATHYVYSPNSGPTTVELRPYQGGVTDVYATCVF